MTPARASPRELCVHGSYQRPHLRSEISPLCIVARHLDRASTERVGDSSFIVPDLAQHNSQSVPQPADCEAGLYLSRILQLQPNRTPRGAEATGRPRFASELAPRVGAACSGAAARIIARGSGAGQNNGSPISNASSIIRRRSMARAVALAHPSDRGPLTSSVRSASGKGAALLRGRLHARRQTTGDSHRARLYSCADP